VLISEYDGMSMDFVGVGGKLRRHHPIGMPLQEGNNESLLGVRDME